MKKKEDHWEATAHFNEVCIVRVNGKEKKFWLFKGTGLTEQDAIDNVKEYCRKHRAKMPEPVEIMNET